MTVELRLVRLAGLAVVASAALALADRWGALRLDRSLFLAALCALAAAALLATARPSESLYGGLVARLAPRRGVPCWAARALVLVLAPVAGAGAVLYALGGLVEALARRPQPLPAMDWRRTAATGLLGVAVLLLARRAGVVIGSEALIWSVCLVASGLSLLWATAGVRVAGGRDPLEDTTVRVQIAVGLILAGVASVLSSSWARASCARRACSRSSVWRGSARRSVPRWRTTCMTQCCRRSRSCSDVRRTRSR